MAATELRRAMQCQASALRDQGLGYDEIGRVLGCSANNARQLVATYRARLQTIRADRVLYNIYKERNDGT